MLSRLGALTFLRQLVNFFTHCTTAGCGFQRIFHMTYCIFVERSLLREWWFFMVSWRKIIWQL